MSRLRELAKPWKRLPLTMLGYAAVGAIGTLAIVALRLAHEVFTP